MEINIQFPTVLYAVISVLCGLTGIILLLFSKSTNSANKLLGFSYLSFAFVYVVIFAIDSRLIIQLPHLYRVGNIFALLYMPLSYLCVRTFITRKNPDFTDLIHALPAVLYFIDLAPFLFSSADHKISVLTQTMRNLTAVTEFKETWLIPGKFYTIGRSALMAFYWVLQVRLLIGLYRKSERTFLENNANWLKWQRVYNSFQFFVFFPTLLFLLLGFDYHLYRVLNMSAGISVLLTALSMFFYPGVLYGAQNLQFVPTRNREEHENRPTELGEPVHNDFQDGDGENTHLSVVGESFNPYTPLRAAWRYEIDPVKSLFLSKSDERKYYHFSPEQVADITKQLSALMEKEMPFLKEGYSIKDLALQINLPVYQLSAFINLETRMHFNDYINRLRISYCENLIEKGETDNLNLFGLAAKCGFHNRNTFATAFKKYTGRTPSAFLKSNNRYLKSKTG